MREVVTLTTDFGTRDSYVSEIKGVILSGVRSDVELIDITHQVSVFDIAAGAFQLLRSYRYFPPTAVHLCVVDPGVGTGRRALFIRTGFGSFVGPDNGVLLWAVRDAEKRTRKKSSYYEITVEKGVLPTFHGRDLFAPFLVALLNGRKIKLKKVTDLQGREFPESKTDGDRISTEVLYTDHFGNIVTALDFNEVPQCYWMFKKQRVEFFPNYQSIPPKKLGLIRGSHGFWELAAHRASAAALCKLKAGDRLTLSV